jgi:ferrous iron transport protein B
MALARLGAVETTPGAGSAPLAGRWSTPMDRPGPAPRRIALVGNPNVGKSVVFGALTGTYVTVSNYPGTTVEVARAPARWSRALELIDTPGVHGLGAQSEDERVTRDILLAGIDVAVQVADAKNLPRALALSLELAESGLPFVLVLNMVDEAAERGLAIDAERLAGLLGTPVVETVAVAGRGLGALRRALERAAPSRLRTAYPSAVERAIARVEPSLAGLGVPARWLALMGLAGDETLHRWLATRVPARARGAIEDTRRELEARFRGALGYELARARSRAAAALAREVTRASAAPAPGAEPAGTRAVAAGLGTLVACLALLAGDLGLVPLLARGPARATLWAGVAAAGIAAHRSPALRAALARWASRRAAGLAVLFVVLYVVHRFVGAFAAGTAVDFLEETVFGEVVNPIVAGVVDGAVAALGPATGTGAGAARVARDLLVGPYGLVTVALTYALAIILPIVTAFFLAFSVLEDAGYLPRLAVVVNRAFRAMGLNGRAVLPMVLGLGCDTMATLTARILETRKERLLVTLLLALAVPCSAQLGVTLALLGALPPWAPAVWGGVVLGVLFAVGFVAARLLPGERSDLILEVPPIRAPRLGNIVLKTLARLEWYLREAVPVFVLGTLVLFALDAAGALGRIVRWSEPAVVGVLGLPAAAAEAFLLGFFRRDYGAAGIYALARDGQLAPGQTVVALVTITLFVPCVANVFVIVKERGLGTALAVVGFVFPFAFLVGGAVNVALRAAGLR